jgi:hypothetical protein
VPWIYAQPESKHKSSWEWDGPHQESVNNDDMSPIEESGDLDNEGF